MQTLILVGPLHALQFRLGCIKFSALQTLEVDLSAEKQWSKAMVGMQERLKRLLNAGLQKLVLKSIWFDQWEDIVDILHDAKERVGELVCVDVICTLQSGEGRKLEIDLSAILMQQGAVRLTSALFACLKDMASS